MEKFTTGTGQKMLVHDKKDCTGYCCVHNPSSHHMVDWPLHWRGDIGIMERICPCGVGHPDPDDLAYKLKILGAKEFEKRCYEVHGCCGHCCG